MNCKAIYHDPIYYGGQVPGRSHGLCGDLLSDFIAAFSEQPFGVSVAEGCVFS